MADIILAAGGTGGHIFPALAVAETLQAHGHRVTLFTDKRGEPMVEGKISYRLIRSASPFKSGLLAKLGGLASLSFGLVQSILAMLARRPACVIGFGGYPSLAPILAGRLMRATCLLHEQNAVMGRANRLLGKWAHHVALSFAVTKGAPTGPNTHITGLPVRAAFAEIAPYQNNKDRLHIAVIGGSLGAQIFADVIPQAIALLPDDIKANLTITQQARDEHVAPLKAHYEGLGITADVARFFHDVASLYETSDIIISRSGASSVQEIATAGRASLLIPFAGALDDHQTGNAMRLVEAGGAVMINEAQADGAMVTSHLEALITDHAKRRDMAQAAQSIAFPDASHAIASLTGLLPTSDMTIGAAQ